MAGRLHRSHPQLPQKQNAGCRSFDSSSGMNCHDSGCISSQVLSVYLETGTAKYAVRTHNWVDSSTCNLSIVIYIFRACENAQKSRL